MIVDFLRSCHSSQWRFYEDDDLIVTRGHFYFVPKANPCLPFPHDFYSGTWMQGDPMEGSPTGPVAGASRPWRDGYLDIDFPPPVAVGTEANFSGTLSFPEDKNVSTLRAGIPELCWTAAGFPFKAFDTVSDLKNCCVRTMYARLIELVYDEDNITIDAFFSEWLGTATVTHFPENLLDPAMTIVTTPQYAIVIVSGTTNFQQLATQATTGFLGPTNFGGVRTIKLWFDCATLIFERLETLGVTPAQSLLLTGHSYGAAACSIVALRTMLANPTQEVFLLTYGMPKPCDQAGMEVLDALHRIHVFNTGDVVPQIPLAVYQSQWFLGVISDVLVRKWGAWAQSEEYLIQSIGGRKELNHLPGLTADVLQPLLSTVFIDHRIPTIQAHKISEYVLRSCLGCDCPRWPFLQPEWDILFSDQCGGRGFRFAADVINRTFGGEPHGRYRFSSAVRDVPPIPGNCYYLCLDASSSQYAGSPVLPIFGIPQLTIMFRARRLGTDNGGIVSVDAATENRLELTSADAFDGNIYAIVGRGDSVAFGRTPVEPGHLWHHYAMVFDGTQTGDTARLKVYVDGVERTLTYFGVGIPALTPSTPGAENIGRAPGSFFTTGDMDDVAIFTSALSATDVADIASRAQDPTAFDPLQLLRFEEGEGTVAHDTSGNGHDVTLFNGASFCFDVCLARSAARYKFKALVIVVDPVVGITLGKYKFAGRVHEGDPVGDPVEGKFRFSSYVGSVEGPGDPIEGKFKFSHSIWTRTVAGSTLSIQFVASEGQSLTWDNAVGGGGPGQTIYFWAKRDGSGNSGIYSVGGQGDPQSVCELSVIYSAGTLGVIGRVSCYVEEELFSTVGRSGLPVDNSWHHYAMVFQTGFGGDPNSMQLYIDGEPVHTTIEPQAVPFEFVRGGGIDNVGVDSLGNFTNGKMDNVVWAQFALTDGQIHGIANADLDPADVGGFVILRWEMDTGGLAWQDFIYDWVDGFVGSPSHSTDVPPLLKD